MLTLSVGPFPLPIAVMVMMVALFVAAWAGRLAGRSHKISISKILNDMLITAMLMARIAFVIVWFDTYRSAPWSMLDIRDGGFIIWVGLVAALLVAIWRGWRSKPLRKPLFIGIAAGTIVCGAMFGAITQLNNTMLPKVALRTLAGEPVDLVKLAAGKPMVINLWASWCPPCRREMPVLAAAQKREKEVLFIFANQGEEAITVKNYLTSAGLTLAYVYLDSGTNFGHEVGSTALPTTLFYDPSGRMNDSRVGELSEASLTSKLEQLHAPK